MHVSVFAKLTLWVNRTIGVILTVLIFSMPALLRWYETIRVMESGVTTAISIAFYCCCVPVAAALWEMDAILRNILRKEIFVRKNVSCIRRIRWYCMATGLICLPAAFFYPPLVFIFVIMVFLSLVVSVLSSVMHAAVEIREENDLTI